MYEVGFEVGVEFEFPSLLILRIQGVPDGHAERFLKMRRFVNGKKSKT
jgi:hypothetical protein